MMAPEVRNAIATWPPSGDTATPRGSAATLALHSSRPSAAA